MEHAGLKVLIPLVAIAMVFLVARFRGLSLHEDLGLRGSSLTATFFWVGLAAVWMLASNALVNWRGPWDFTPWRETPMLANTLRVLAVGILGPIAEELIFRGLLYGRLAGTRLGAVGSIVVLALAWALIHTSYSATVIAVIFVEGLLLGAARWRTGSVLAPILMHIVWNFYAVW